MLYSNGDIYEGEWMKGLNHGQGVIRLGEFLALCVYSLINLDSQFLKMTFQLVSKRMETGMMAPGRMGRRMAQGGSAIQAKVNFMKAFG